MDLKEYLETLSKEDLISLLIDLSGTNPSVDSFLTEKQSALNTQVEQNESLLSETNSLFNQPLTINRQSSPQEKIDLFKSLFSGRQDVFALRWFNSKSNKSGYSPVCGNKWIPEKCDLKKYSCATCPYKLPARTTPITTMFWPLFWSALFSASSTLRFPVVLSSGRCSS